MQRVANAAYSEGFPFSGLLSVAPYCVPGGVGVVSLSVCTLRDQRQVLVNLVCHDDLLIAYPEEQAKEGTTFVGQVMVTLGARPCFLTEYHKSRTRKLLRASSKLR